MKREGGGVFFFKRERDTRVWERCFFLVLVLIILTPPPPPAPPVLSPLRTRPSEASVSRRLSSSPTAPPSSPAAWECPPRGRPTAVSGALLEVLCRHRRLQGREDVHRARVHSGFGPGPVRGQRCRDYVELFEEQESWIGEGTGV